ncbi:uncharacterized protein LOC101849992 [Aplysia californica]|uniref:Uncharacterized protein LOC101849992 n=1 Tax=Aplysia californica TaxID=6500 RepID=A0ABM0ZUT6_APLCA|nr:uncharacterized protein LOC101849992 [Aplysia californica]
MKAFQTILVAVFMAGLTVADDTSNCKQNLQGCAFPMLIRLDHHMDTVETFLSFVQSTTVDEVCTWIFEPVAECFGDALNTTVCRSVGRDLDMARVAGDMRAVITYSCSPEGRSVVESMQQSVCLRDAPGFWSVYDLLEKCDDAMTAQLEPSSDEGSLPGPTPGPDVVCPIVAQTKSCMVDGVGSLCGEASEEFFRQIWTPLSNSMTGQTDCGEGLRRASENEYLAIDCERFCPYASGSLH